MLCLIVVQLPPGKNPFAIKIITIIIIIIIIITIIIKSKGDILRGFKVCTAQ
jgi:hypothetical protein